jgi:hypothetical protein
MSHWLKHLIGVFYFLLNQLNKKNSCAVEHMLFVVVVFVDQFWCADHWNNQGCLQIS